MKPNIQPIKTFLEQTITAWAGMPIAEYNKLILDQGTTFVGAISSDAIKVAKEWRKLRKPKIKQCFYNSQLFLLVEGVGEYYEGYCFDGLIPFHHAWVVIDLKVVDFTLEARNRLFKRKKIAITGEPVYLGVPVPRQILMQNMVKTGVAEPMAHKHYFNSNLRFL